VALLEFRNSPSEVASRLAGLPWDSEPIVTLERRHVIATLLKYLNSEIGAADVEAWANCVEGRDDIGFHPEHEEALKRVIWHLANPSLTHELSVPAAQELITALAKSA
jgi:hypothetical protein